MRALIGTKEQSSLVIQSLVMSIDLYRNGKTSFYTNLVKLLNYYNIPFTNGLVSTNETIILKKHNNAFQFSEHVSMFQKPSSSIMNI